MATLRTASDYATKDIAFIAEGDGQLRHGDFFQARESIQPEISLEYEWGGVLVGFTPAHFAGWSSSDLLNACDNFMELANYGDLDHEVACLWAVGEREPSAELLTELLQHREARVRELALSWLAPRVEAVSEPTSGAWAEFDAALDAVREDAEQSGASSMTERELTDAAEAAKQAYRRERRDR
jgi:hypothetical protein